MRDDAVTGLLKWWVPGLGRCDAPVRQADLCAGARSDVDGEQESVVLDPPGARECVAAIDGLQLQRVLTDGAVDLVDGVRRHARRIAETIAARSVDR